MMEKDLIKQTAFLMRREKALSSFGTFAFYEDNLQKVLDEAARVCAECLEVPFAKICRYQSAQNDLVVVAGQGWNAGVVGFAISAADESTPQGRAFRTGQPQVCNNIEETKSFKLPAFYRDHRILSTIDVIVATKDGEPFGILEADDTLSDTFDQHDIDFLTGFGNVLAEAVATSIRASELRCTVARMATLVEEKEILSQELKHRVRNSLHLIYGLLTHEVDRKHDEGSILAFRSIALRVLSLAHVFDHLLGTGMSRVINLGTYVAALCASLPELYLHTKTKLVTTVESVQVELDQATSLGIIVTELVNNAYLHAFEADDDNAEISVKLRIAEDEGWLEIADNGIGFTEVETPRRGMKLVKRLVQQMGGTIDLQTDRGSKWTVRFPAHKHSKSET
jgi:two-component sensor histidine kinase